MPFSQIAAEPVWNTGEDRGHYLKNHTQGGVTSKIQSHSFYLVPGLRSSPEPGPYLPGAEELKEQGDILIGGQVVAKGGPWRLPAPSFPAQKTQDTSSFCKLEKGSRQGQCQSRMESEVSRCRWWARQSEPMDRSEKKEES